MDAERTDTAAILYTGGTTGIPKAVMLSHENINAAIHTVVHHEKSTEYDKALCFLPFNQVFGQMHIMNATILSGGCQELMPGFDLDRVLALMKAGRITKFFSVPTIYVRPLTLDGLKETMSDVRYCVDGLKDMIITGGENVYSLEVEEVLYAHPNVQEFAVIGTPEKEWGERVTTVILPKPGQTIDQKQLRDFLKAGLSAYKVPKPFSMVDDFPGSPAGKLLKRKLRESVLESEDSA